MRMNENFLSEFHNMHQSMRNIFSRINSTRGTTINAIRISTNGAPRLQTHLINSQAVDLGNGSATREGLNLNDLENRFTELHNFWRRPSNATLNFRADDVVEAQEEESQEQADDSDSPSFDFRPFRGAGSRILERIRGRNASLQRQNQMFRVDFHTQRRLNPLGDSQADLGYSSSLQHGIFGQPNIFQEDLQESDSESGMMLAEDEHFDILEHDDYSSGTDINEDPIGVNMDGLRLPIEEEEEINVMEINNEFQDERFGDFLEPNNENQGANANLLQNQINGNPQELIDFELENNQPGMQHYEMNPNPNELVNQEIHDFENMLRNRHRFISEEVIREEDQMDHEALDPNDLDQEIHQFSQTSESFFPEFTNSLGEEESEGADHCVNISPESNSSREWEDRCSFENSVSHLSLEVETDQILSKEDLMESKEILEESQKMQSSKNSLDSKQEIEEEEKETVTIQYLKKLPFLASVLGASTQPFISLEHNQSASKNQKRKTKRTKQEVCKSVMTFRINADIWGEKYFDLLSFYCRPKFQEYPFRFPRRLYFDLTKINCDFGSKLIAMMLSNTDYTLRTTTWTNLPVVHKPSFKHFRPESSKESKENFTNLKDKKENEQSSRTRSSPNQNILFSDIRVIALALKKENLFWKKNLEEFSSVSFREWGLSFTRNLMELDSLESLSKRLLSKSKDFYNFAREIPNKKGPEMSNFDFLKHLYWTNNNSKQSILEKITVLEHNMFSVSSFDFIKSLGSLMRNSSPCYQAGMVPLESKDISKNDFFENIPSWSIFEALKKNLKSRESSLSRKIEHREKGFQQLRKMVSSRREVQVDSGHFNLVFLNELNKYSAKEKKAEDKKKVQKKIEQLLEFGRKNIGYFDLAQLDLEDTHSYLIPEENKKKIKSVKSQDKSALDLKRTSKEFTLSGPDVNQINSNPITPNPPLTDFRNANLIRSDPILPEVENEENDQIEEEVLPNEENQEDQEIEEEEGEELDDDEPNPRELHEEVQRNIPRDIQRRTEHDNDDGDRQEEENNQENNGSHQVIPQNENEIQINIDLRIQIDRENPQNQTINPQENQLPNESNDAPNPQENEILEAQETQNGPEELQNDENDREGQLVNENDQEQIREEINSAIQEVEERMERDRPQRFNFVEIGLPENFLEIAGIPEEVFNTYTPEIQNDIINIYAADLNLFDQPLIPQITQPNNPAPNANPSRVPANTNPNPTPSNNGPNTLITSPAPLENPILEEVQENPDPQANAELPALPANTEGQTNTTPVEVTQPAEVEQSENPPVVQNERHFLLDLEPALRASVLAEMPQDQIDLLPLELRNQANQIRAERGILNNANVIETRNPEVVVRRTMEPIADPGPNLFRMGTMHVQVNGNEANRNATARASEEYERIEMQYNGINKIKKCLKESTEMIGKLAKNNREKNFFSRMYHENKMQGVRASSPEIFDLLMGSVGFLNNNSALRVAFPYLITRMTEHKFNRHMILKIKSMLTFLKSRSEEKGLVGYIEINPREKTFLKNILLFMTDTIKTHNSYFIVEKDHVRSLFNLFKEIVLIKEEVIKFRFLLLLISAIRFRVDDKKTDKSLPKFVTILHLDFDVLQSEVETMFSLLLDPDKLHGKKEFLAHLFYMVDILMLNPKNTPVLIEGISEFINRFCEKINVQFTNIKKLTFEKKIKIKESEKGDEKKKRKVRLITKTLGDQEKIEVKGKVEQLQVHIMYLLKVFEKLEVIFIKMVNQTSERQQLFEYLEKQLVEHAIDFLRRRESGVETERFVKFKRVIHQFQRRFFEEVLQDIYLKFANILRKRNLKSMFKNMFLILRVFEENFTEMVERRPLLSFPLFYKLEPLLETFLIFYKMISNSEIQDFFKQELTKKVISHKKEMKRLYKAYENRFSRVRDKGQINELISKLEQSQTTDLMEKNGNSIVEEKESSIECSLDLGLYRPKKAEIKTSEYRPKFNQPEREKRGGFERENPMRVSQRMDTRNRSQNESAVTEYSLDKHDLSYLMAKNDSSVQGQDSRLIKTQIFTDIRNEFDKLFRTGVNMNKKVINHIIQSKQKIWTSSFYIVVKTFPGLIKFENKRKFFRQFIQTISNRKVQRISVERLNLFQTTFTELANQPREFFHRKWNISFIGEEGEDAGGVSREFYLNLSRAFLNPNYNYFRPASHGYAFHPSPTAHLTGSEPGVFKFIGRIVGKALFDGYFLDAHFTRAFYKQMIGHPLTYEDFEDYDPQYFKNLKWLINNDPAPLEMTFTVEHNEFGLTQEVELKPGGAQTKVTQENKNEYVDLLLKHKLCDQAKLQIQQFLRGLYDVVPLSLLRIFDPKEIELMISGLPEININDLEKHTEYVGYTKDAQVIKWFWKTIRSYDSNLKAGFLQFVTGTSKVPLEGFEYLKGMGGNIQRFQIHKSFNPQNLPTSHTCMNQLDLPEYASEEELREKLTKAVEFGKEGFGFV